MARPGITYHEVASTATKLVEQNIHPSIEAVRNALGTGSNSTINRHLRDWRTKQGASVELEQGLPETLLIAVRGLYDAMNDNANQKCAALAAEHSRVTADLKTKIEALEKNQASSSQKNIALTQQLNQESQAKSALKRNLEQLNKNLEAQTTDNTLLNARLTDKQTEIDRLTQQMKQVQANLEHYRESIRAERLAEKQQNQEKVTDLERRLQSQQTIILSEKEQQAQLKQEIASVQETKTTALKTLNEALTTSKTHELALQKSQLSYQQLSEKYDQLLANNDDLSKTSSADKAKAHDLALKVEKYSERVSMLEIALKKTEDHLADLGNKNLFLAQEKAELAFQLNQLQEKIA